MKQYLILRKLKGLIVPLKQNEWDYFVAVFMLMLVVTILYGIAVVLIFAF